MRTETLNRCIGSHPGIHGYYIVTALIFGLGIWLAACKANAWVLADRVADGDTIILRDGRHVRYIGIDTPEIDHDNHRASPMGYEARAFNQRLVEGRRLQLDFDRERKDRYGRTLAYVYRSDGLFVNAELLRQGFAHVLYHFPNTSKDQYLLSIQREAMQAGRGLWAMISKSNIPSHAYRGNRRSRRFHAHDCPMGKTMSDRNRVWLKNRWAAFWSGYAPARECILFPAP